MLEFSGQGLSVESQVPLKVIYKEQNTSGYYADLLVEGRAITEITSVANLLKEHQAQLLNLL